MLWSLLNISRKIRELAAVVLQIWDGYFNECMKFSRLYSVSYCSWSHSSPRFSSTDFIDAFPEEVEVSAFSVLPSFTKEKKVPVNIQNHVFKNPTNSSSLIILLGKYLFLLLFRELSIHQSNLSICVIKFCISKQSFSLNWLYFW